MAASDTGTPGRTPLTLAGLVAAALAGFALAPGPWPDKLALLAAGVCRQRPDHSYFLGGSQLPLEARMGGLFAGFLVGVFWLWCSGRERAGLLPPRGLQAVLAGGVALLALDGTNALLYDLGLPALYPPHNALRLATGLLCGLALALLAAPVWAAALWRDWDLEPSVAHPRELLAPLALLGLIYAATVSGQGRLYYPVASVLLLGVLAAFTLANSYALALLLGRQGQARTWGQALTPLLGGLLVSLGELAALAALRYGLAAALGLEWPV
ncbi:MAG TPA: DUF2085 domain-containing protein [Chloroflexota bacterium]|jgi:uncharacterized membrane protein|nr:DUF2085 domain-containing protein [Chloroflexota bacterium]